METRGNLNVVKTVISNRKFRSYRPVPLLLFLLWAFHGAAQPLPIAPAGVVPTNTQVATLMWNESPSAETVGYKIYFWRPGGVTNAVNVGNVTEAQIHGLTFPTSFYATAYDAKGMESVPSNLLKEVHWEIDLTVKAQASQSPGGTFTNAFTVLTKTNVSGLEFYRLLTEVRRELRATP